MSLRILNSGQEEGMKDVAIPKTASDSGKCLRSLRFLRALAKTGLGSSAKM